MKYNQKSYECLNDILDYDYAARQIIRVENTRKIYNIKQFLKKKIDIVEKNREENKVEDNDADLITNNVHIVYEMCKCWFVKFWQAQTKIPKLREKIRKLERENEILHSRLSKALLRIEKIDNSEIELPDDCKEEMSSVDKMLGQKYTLED